MLFTVLIIINILILFALLFFSILPIIPRFSKIRLNLRRAPRIILSFLFLALITSNVLLGICLSQKENESVRSEAVESFAVKITLNHSDLSEILSMLPAVEDKEIEAAALEHIAAKAYSATFDVDAISYLYWEVFPKGTEATFTKSNTLEKHEDYRVLLENISSALQRVADRHGDNRIFTPSVGEREILDAIHEIADLLKRKKAEQLQKDMPNGFDYIFSEYEICQNLLQSDPEIRDLYHAIDDYVDKGNRN